MNKQRLVRAIVIGTLAQLGMVIAGHYVAAVRENFMFGGLTLSLLAGALYGLRARGGWGATLAAGAIAGGVCALVGIAVSCLLGDVAVPVLLFGTLGSTVAGLVGAMLARILVPASPDGPEDGGAR